MQEYCKKRQGKRKTAIFILVLFSFIFGFSAAFSLTSALLSDSKTATGTIAFEFDSPALSFGNTLELYCEGVSSANATITFGSSTETGTALSSLYAFNLFVEQNDSPFTEYYVKVIYDFSSVTNATIGLGSSTFLFGNVTMSVPQTSATNVLYSQSVASQSDSTQAKVPVGESTTFDIYSVLKNMTFFGNSEFSTATPLEFIITIVADTSPNFNSKHRAQVNLIGKLGAKVVESPALTLGGLLSDGFNMSWSKGSTLSFTNKSTTGDSRITANVDVYLTIIINFDEYARTEDYLPFNDSVVATNGEQSENVLVTHSIESADEGDVFWNTSAIITLTFAKLSAGYSFDFQDLFGTAKAFDPACSDKTAKISIYYTKNQGDTLKTFQENISGTTYFWLGGIS